MIGLREVFERGQGPSHGNMREEEGVEEEVIEGVGEAVDAQVLIVCSWVWREEEGIMSRSSRRWDKSAIDRGQ